MGSKYYAPGAERAAKVGDLFAKIARRYDLVNDLQSLGLHRWWKRRLVRLAAPRPGQRALDVCCGTGDVTFRLADAGAAVVGVDFSAPMLDVARSRLRRNGGKRPEFLQGDARHLPFPDGSFDVVAISYGLRNVADFHGCLAEMTRVLRHGGRLLVLEFGIPESAWIRWAYFQYLRRVSPALGRLFFGEDDTHGYILESLLAYPAQKGVDAALKGLGYTETRIENFMGGAMSLNIGIR
jgi:demethylmenaquinone methyltransferase/2-methoxy-6-polyprenyl-1,4-benzoquinol methylase